MYHQKLGKEGTGRNTEPTLDENKVLVKYCLFSAKLSNPLSVAQIRGFAWAIIKTSSRKSQFRSTSGGTWKWWLRFGKRQPEVTLRKPDNLGRGW